MAFGVILVVIGAFFVWGVTESTNGLHINTFGLILVFGGVVCILLGLLGLLVDLVGGWRRSTHRDDDKRLPGGSRRTPDQGDDFRADP